jgi:hypothetical protein
MKGKFGKKEKALMWDLAFELDLERSEAAESWVYSDETLECSEGDQWRDVWLCADTFHLFVGWNAGEKHWFCDYIRVDGDKHEPMRHMHAAQASLRDALRCLTEQARA